MNGTPYYLSPPSPLRENDLVLFNFGPKSWVPMQVKRRALTSLIYDPVLQGTLSGVLAPAGATPGTGQVSAFQQNLLFGLSSTITSINGVPDVFKTAFDYEILEAYVGIAPSWCRVWIQQPGGTGTFVTPLDNNVTPSSSYPDVGFFDGYADGSPFKYPTERSGFYVFGSYSASFSLYNPHTIPINPRLNFLLNRVFMAPVTDPKMMVRMFQHSVPVRSISVGLPDTQQNFNGKLYGNIAPIPEALPFQALSSDTPVATAAQKALKQAGYCP